MKLNKIDSKILEYLLIAQYSKESYDNFKNDNRDFYELYKDDITFIGEKLEKIEEKIAQNYCLQTQSFEETSFVISIYIKAVLEGRNFTNLEDFFDYLRNLEDEVVLKEVFTNASEEERENLMQYIDSLDISSEKKWHLTKVVINTKEVVNNCIEIIEYVAEFYNDIYKKYTNERENYFAKFDIDNILSTNVLGDELKKEIKANAENVAILSPVCSTLMFWKVKSLDKTVLLISVDIEKILETDTASSEQFSDMLKLLSDKTRYDVLKMLARPNVKTKEIAQELNISSAAVSFHTKKLIDNKFLVINTDGSGVKYNINKQQIEEVINKLKEDFLK